MKKLLASGCSWTDADFVSHLEFLPDEKRGGWPMWPEIIGKELGLEVINSAEQGRGNAYIGQSICDNIIKYGDEVEMVAVLWTETSRYDIYESTAMPIPHILAEINGNTLSAEMFASNVDHLTTNPFKWSIDEWIRHDVFNSWNTISLRAMYTIAEMCTYRNIKCIFDQGLLFFWHDELESIKDAIHKEMYITELDYMTLIENNKIYQRLIKDYGHLFIKPKALLHYEYTVGYMIHKRNDLKLYWKNISTNAVDDYNKFELDGHPNAEGQKKISERFLINV